MPGAKRSTAEQLPSSVAARKPMSGEWPTHAICSTSCSRVHRSIAVKSLLRGFAIALCIALFGGFATVITNASEAVGTFAFFLFYIAAFVLMIRGAWQSRRSALTSDATGIFVMSTPFAVMILCSALGMEDQNEAPTIIFIAIVGLLAFSPVIQRLLNRLRVLPA